MIAREELGPPTSMDELIARVEAAQATVETEAENPVTIADVAAAAFVALETLVGMLGPRGQQVIDEFEKRAATFAASMEEAQGE